MRLLICIGLLALTGLVHAKEPTSAPTETLADLIAQQKFVTYSFDKVGNAYRIGFLTDKTLDRSRKYYANRSANLIRYREIVMELAKKRSGSRTLRGTPNAAGGEVDESVAELEQELASVSNPTGSSVGEITRRGVDFFGIRELGASREYLIPYARIIHVSIPSELQTAPEAEKASD